MKYTLIILLFLNTCSNFDDKKKTINEQNNTPKNEILEYYEMIDNFPIYISTEIGEIDPESDKFEYRGREIPSIVCNIFGDIFYYNTNSDKTEVFGTKAFDIDSLLIGLLTRIPGDYWSSRIWLLIYDNSCDSIVNHIEIAESWGDAGDIQILECEINKSIHGSFNINVQKEDCWAIDETLEEIECVDSTIVYELIGKRISQKERKKAST